MFFLIYSFNPIGPLRAPELPESSRARASNDRQVTVEGGTPMITINQLQNLPNATLERINAIISGEAPAAAVPVVAAQVEPGEIVDADVDESDLLASPSQDNTISKWKRHDTSDEEK